MIQQPILVVCRSDVAAMLTVNEWGWYTDDGVVYEASARTRPFFPGGQGGEAIFTTLWITTVTYDADVALFVTPFIDGVALETQRVDIAGAANPDNIAQVHELFLSVPFIRDGIERMRNAPRGGSIDVKVATQIAGGAGSSTRQIVAGIEVETEVVRDTRTPV